MEIITVATVLFWVLVLWMLGVVSTPVTGSLVQILLVSAIAVLLVRGTTALSRPVIARLVKHRPISP